MPLKIFIVSHAGKTADVTLQSSCSTLDESVLKVSSFYSHIFSSSLFSTLWKQRTLERGEEKYAAPPQMTLYKMIPEITKALF